MKPGPPYSWTVAPAAGAPLASTRPEMSPRAGGAAASLTGRATQPSSSANRKSKRKERRILWLRTLGLWNGRAEPSTRASRAGDPGLDGSGSTGQDRGRGLRPGTGLVPDLADR